MNPPIPLRPGRVLAGALKRRPAAASRASHQIPHRGADVAAAPSGQRLLKPAPPSIMRCANPCRPAWIGVRRQRNARLARQALDHLAYRAGRERATVVLWLVPGRPPARRAAPDSEIPIRRQRGPVAPVDPALLPALPDPRAALVAIEVGVRGDRPRPGAGRSWMSRTIATVRAAGSAQGRRAPRGRAPRPWPRPSRRGPATPHRAGRRLLRSWSRQAGGRSPCSTRKSSSAG